MPDHRSHRGQHPDDARLFAPDQHPRLRAAVHDLSWLLTHGYAEPSAQKIVGDRYTLDARQRSAVARSACSDQALAARLAKFLPPETAAAHPLLIDGYNLLTTLETALGNGVVLLCRDTAVRDIASIHGTYRKTEETPPALELVGRAARDLSLPRLTWYLDRPVSNSGRLAQLLRDTASAHAWDWSVEIVQNPDPILASSDGVIVSADSVILDHCTRAFNLARHIVEGHVPNAFLVDLTHP
jgi:hypothetical protein